MLPPLLSMALLIGSRLGPGAVVIVSGAVFRVLCITLHLHDEIINTQSMFNIKHKHVIKSNIGN